MHCYTASSKDCDRNYTVYQSRIKFHESKETITVILEKLHTKMEVPYDYQQMPQQTATYMTGVRTLH